MSGICFKINHGVGKESIGRGIYETRLEISWLFMKLDYMFMVRIFLQGI